MYSRTRFRKNWLSRRYECDKHCMEMFAPTHRCCSNIIISLTFRVFYSFCTSANRFLYVYDAIFKRELENSLREDLLLSHYNCCCCMHFWTSTKRWINFFFIIGTWFKNSLKSCLRILKAVFMQDKRRIIFSHENIFFINKISNHVCVCRNIWIHSCRHMLNVN